MNERRSVEITRLTSGVPGLDEVLGGGIPEFSFNLIAGTPGSGKTSLAQQIMFHNAGPGRSALYFTVLGEPLIKMLRYQQQFSYFDPEKVNGSIRFLNLSEQVLEQDLGHVLARIMSEVEAASPSLVVVDSFRTVVRAAGEAEVLLQEFIQRLALNLAGWQATTFLVGEYMESEMGNNPVFTVADGILWLHQSVERNSMVRKLEVLKLRGQAPMPGLHTFRITENGLQIFPRIPRTERERPRLRPRISTGVTGLDEMLGGGIQAGDSVLVAGPSGSGKTLLATQFIAEGVRQGEPGVLAIFEEHPEEYLRRARQLGLDLEAMIERDQLAILYLRPLDLSVDETLFELGEAVKRLGARRVVIDSLSGFELALAPTFREDFRESLYRLVVSLTATGVSVLMTTEIVESYTDLQFSPHAVSFLADDIILQRYVELDGELRKVMTVVKMRGSKHSHELRAYEITESGLVVGEALSAYRGLVTGSPVLRQGPRGTALPGLTEIEAAVFHTLGALGEAGEETLADRTGLRRAALRRALARLARLDYITRSAAEDSATYRPAARGPGG